MIEKGWVKVTATSRGGWETLLAIRGPGDILGELSAIDGSPRLGTVTALTPLTVVVISGERLDDLLIRLPSVAVAMVRHLAARLRESDQRRMQYGATNGDARLTVLLVELLERHGRRTDDGYLIALPLSQQELASSVGLSREVVARTLRVLRDRGVVVTRRKQILVLRPDLLRSLARSVSMSTDPT